MASQDLVKGRSQSLNKSIKELMEFLGDNSKRHGGFGVDLRAVLHEKLADFAKHWWQRGVRRGHMECYKVFEASGRLPPKLRYKGTREFFEGQEQRVRVTSRIKARRANAGGTKRKTH